MSSNLLNKTQWETKTVLHSDHLPIRITITITENFRLQQTPKTFTNYKKANWTGFKEEIKQALSNTPAPDNVHTSNKLLANLILTADKHHIPKGQVKTRNSILPTPIRDLIKTRNNLCRTKPTDPNLKQLNDDITKRISDHKTNLWKDKLEQNWDHKQNIHTYWNTLNRLNNKKSPEQPNKNMYFNNKPARTPIQKATAFNKQFANTVKHATKRTNRKVTKQTKKLHCEPILISNHQTTQAIKDTKNNNSTGPDNVNIRHLKHFSPLDINYLTEIFNLSLNQNIIPQIWKLAKIIPIPKPSKDPGLGTSYRPISPLSPIAKIMEKSFFHTSPQTSQIILTNMASRHTTPPPQLYTNSQTKSHKALTNLNHQITLWLCPWTSVRPSTESNY